MSMYYLYKQEESDFQLLNFLSWQDWGMHASQENKGVSLKGLFLLLLVL